MVLDKIPGPTIFTQRDVRETPAATATATAVSLTDPTYVTLSNSADLINERILTAGEGLNLSDGGANNAITISGENASDSNKGIAKFQLSDFSVSTGDVSLKAVVVMSVDGDTGTATPALNNLDILGGTGISTVGGANDITITSTHASDDGSSHANVATNTTHISSDGSDHSLLANKTSFLSIPGGSWIPINPDVQNVFVQRNLARADATGIFFSAPVNLPQGAIVTACIVHGNAGATAETWELSRTPLDSTTRATMATANFDTEDSSISNATIDNSTFVYTLSSTDIDSGDEILGARITYTTDYD